MTDGRVAPALVKSGRRAVESARAGRRAEARGVARELLEGGAAPPNVAAAAARVLFVARAHDEAFQAALASEPELAWSIADRLGWFREARSLGERAAARAASNRKALDEARWHARLLALCSRWGDLPAAVAHGSRAASLVPGSAPLWLELSRALARSGDAERALGAADRALALVSARPEVAPLLEIAAVALEAGSVARAEKCLALAAAADGGSSVPLARLATLAGWAGDEDRARELAGRALALEPSSPVAHRVLASLALARGDLAEAERRIEASDRTDPEAAIVLAEIALERGDLDAAMARLPGNFGAREGPPHAVTLVRACILARGEGVPEVVRRELLPVVAELCPEEQSALEAGDPPAWGRALDRARAALRGNRSPTLFRTTERGLVPLSARGTARHDARAVLESVRVVADEELLFRLRRIEEAYPWSSLPACHEGELLLWLGRLPEARAALERSIEKNRGTRWAYIGLTLLACLEGDPLRGLEISATGVHVMRGEGPAVAAYRGEAARRAGRLDEAQVDLERAAALHPDRIAVWPSLGLLRLARGGSAAEELAALAARAPGLSSDAAREAGLSLDAAEAPSSADARSLFEASLRLLRGNRSSTCVTYFSPRGALRSVSRGGPGPHATDAEDLTRAGALLSEP